MKTLSMSAAILLLAFISFAAEPTNPTYPPRFEGEAGRLTIRGYKTLRPVAIFGGEIQISPQENIDAQSHQRDFGADVRVVTGEQSGAVFLPVNELDELIKAVAYLRELDGPVTVMEKWQADYKISEGVTLTRFSTGESRLTIWEISALLSSEAIAEFAERLVFAKRLLVDAIDAVQKK